jgi:hypothetical protein
MKHDPARPLPRHTFDGDGTTLTVGGEPIELVCRAQPRSRRHRRLLSNQKLAMFRFAGIRRGFLADRETV